MWRSFSLWYSVCYIHWRERQEKETSRFFVCDIVVALVGAILQSCSIFSIRSLYVANSVLHFLKAVFINGGTFAFSVGK